MLGALLAGAALVSLLLARYGDRIGRRRAYAALLVVMGGAGSVFALTGWLPALVLASLTGTVSTDVVESGPFTSLEQAMLPHATAREPTRLFGAYNTIATLAGSLGALAAGGPTLLHTGSARWLLVYPVAAALALPVAAGLSRQVEGRQETAGDRLQPGSGSVSEAQPRPPLHRSRGIVYRLAGLFALDSLGGGFVVQAFIAYWFSRKFGTSAATLGFVFFGIGILQALSFQAAVRIAERIGLLRTMVFTHLPSNVLLAAVPLAPSQGAAIALLLGRFALSQMDVPTRQAYVVGVVDPSERTAAAAYTNTARYVARPIGPLLAAPLTQIALGVPFVVGGAIKCVYDLGLYALFRRVKLGGN